MHSYCKHPLALALVSVGAAASCFGQAGRAELFGVIQDLSNLPVPNAKAEAEDQATMVRYSALSDERGEYHILGLPAGQYVLTVQQPGFQQPGQPGFQLPGQPGFQQPGATNQSSVGTSTYVGGNQPYVGGSQPYVGGGSSIGSQPTGPGTPGLIQGNPNPIPPPVQNFGQQGLPGGFPQPGLPQQNFPQQNFPQPQVNQGQINQPVPGGGFQPQAGGAPNAATQLIQNILTTPRQGGLPGAQPAGQQVGGGIAGVASTSENPSIMVYNDRTSYNEWEFIFDFSKQKAVVNPNVGGVIGTPASQIGTVAGPTPQPAVPGLGGGLSSLGQTAQPAIGTSPGAAPFGGANPAANPAAGQTPGGPSQGQAPNNIRMGRP